MRAIRRAMSAEFRDSLGSTINPYGDGNAGERIARVLAEAPLRQELLRKRALPLVRDETGSYAFRQDSPSMVRAFNALEFFWDRWQPLPVKIPVKSFMEKSHDGANHWFDLVKGQCLQGLVARNNHEQRVYVVTIEPEQENAWYYRWPRIINQNYKECADAFHLTDSQNQSLKH